MKLTCYLMSGHKIDIRPAPLKRQWMDDTDYRFAYRCLPLNIANMYGWEILAPADFKASWNGGNDKGAITIVSDAPKSLQPVSHFGFGVLTFSINGLFRTEDKINLWVGGPVNHVKDGIQPLTGIVETDWSPYTFTMNWKFTRPDMEVAFSKGEPVCNLFPIQRGFIDSFEPEFRQLKDDPESEQTYREWSKTRSKIIKSLEPTVSELRVVMDNREVWRGNYLRGESPDYQQVTDEHQVKLKLKPFTDHSGLPDLDTYTQRHKQPRE